MPEYAHRHLLLHFEVKLDSMTSVASKTIDIVTTNGRYTALREGDPVWSRFLPDADVLGNDKEYLVSEEISEVLDSQWAAYNRLLAFLDDIACIEYKGDASCYPRVDDIYRAVALMRTRDDGRETMRGDDGEFTLPGKRYTRRELLECEARGDWKMSHIRRHVDGPVVGSRHPTWKAFTAHKPFTTYRGLPPHEYSARIVLKPAAGELVYYDEVDRIAYSSIYQMDSSIGYQLEA